MNPTYDINREDGDLVIRVRQPGADQEAIERLLDFLELESIRKRSRLTEEDASQLARAVKRGAWERVRQLFRTSD